MANLIDLENAFVFFSYQNIFLGVDQVLVFSSGPVLPASLLLSGEPALAPLGEMKNIGFVLS